MRVDKEKEKEGSEEVDKQAKSSFIQGLHWFGDQRGQDVKSVGKGTQGLVDIRSFTLSVGELDITKMNA